MTEPISDLPSIRGLGHARRREVAAGDGSWVREAPGEAEGGLPWTLSPVSADVDLPGWARQSRELLETRLAEHGAVLCRGFRLRSPAELATFVEAVAGGLMDYEDRTSPRSVVAGNVYTSTDYPPAESIFLHNENSYSERWPTRIFFHCMTVAAEGGATPIADCAKVYQRLDSQLRGRFEERGVMYVRNFGEGLGLPWSEVFQTSDRGEVEARCRAAGIELEWRGDERLRTRQIRPATLRHPQSGERIWFNQVPLFHVGMLEHEVRAELFRSLGEESLPSHAYYGDGTPISDGELAAICAAYEAETRVFGWREGDVLVLDNVRMAHGRQPFSGPRKVVVGMGRPCSWSEVAS